MLIEIKDNIVWNTDSNKQSEEAIQWLQNDVLPLLNESTPLYDTFKRPYSWVVIVDNVQIEKRRNYINESTSWAMASEQIIVNKQ